MSDKNKFTWRINQDYRSSDSVALVRLNGYGVCDGCYDVANITDHDKARAAAMLAALQALEDGE